MTDTSTDQSDAGTSDEILEELQAWLDQNWDPELTVGEWWERLGLSGWAAPGLPTHAYGKGLSRNDSVRAQAAIAEHGALGAPGGLGLLLAAPTIATHGTQAQIDHYVRRIVTGVDAWCQLFSEPGAGSDLAGLSTRALRDGDEWVVTGQKVWTTGAHYSDLGILLARTDPDVPKHRGITAIAVDMRAPGVDVRPLRQIDGTIHFNEVFLDEVRVPVADTIGPVGSGWGVALTMLTNERASIGGGSMYGVDQLVQLARESGRLGDPLIRQRLADMYIRDEILRFLGYRVRTAAASGRPPGPESSVMKLAVSARYEVGGDLMLDIEGAAGALMGDDAPYGGRFQDLFMGQWAPRIGGGTDQVQRNIIGERVLGLPGDIRVDKDVAFRDLPRA